MSNYDLFALGLFLVLFFGYHYTYLFLSYTLKKETRENKIDYYRQLWIDLIIEREEPVFAIQSIRNMTMTSTYLISLAMILMGGLISILFSNQNLIKALDIVDKLDIHTYFDYLSNHPAALKILLGLFIILLSIYNFTISLRILNNMNVTMPTVIRRPEEREFQIEQIRRQSRHFLTGIRALYYFFGPILWVFDTNAMVVFTIVTTVAFFRFDFLPRVKVKTDI